MYKFTRVLKLDLTSTKTRYQLIYLMLIRRHINFGDADGSEPLGALALVTIVIYVCACV